MKSRYYLARIKALFGKEEIKEESKPVNVKNVTSKAILCFVEDKLVAEYDSLTKCGNALGLSRPAVKKAIESGMLLDNGFTLKFK